MNSAEKQLAILLEFGKVINKTKSLNDVLESMANFARDILQADRCSIFVYNKEKEELWSKVAHEVHPIHISTQKGVAGYSALSKETQIVVDAYNDYRFNPDVDKATGYLTHTILAVPLLDNQENTIGVFQALNKKEGFFTNVDAELLLLISNYAASAIENAILYDKLRDTQTKIINKLASVAEFKDQETSKHTKRVGLYSALLADKMGLNQDDIYKIELAAPMHDAGKIGITDTILLKPDRLDQEEFDIVKTHTQIGYDLLFDSENEYLKTAALIALEHHEKWDGTGYPLGKKGEEISIFGRIVAIADVFDALISVRTYKPAWSFEEAYEFLKKNRGTHFDPILIDLFSENIERIRAIYLELRD
ncbi:HD domain-containing protein [Sulfurospirillum diekertiae]|uniref:HD domain-containing protein n=1 Tax=Sulfurospirillum diekertiae TaxID=1854492 RepID=A0A6G9VUB8_9BACT|nr:HD domain-containing phosphohydrolase [Sulfurospirillum diekertiae]QIR76984.1 HD domain-containing protein [Sulfurospirillum diekertiae]QIR79599.1 HD domain-containing protein [Sulfurospirillum diekertiae]